MSKNVGSRLVLRRQAGFAMERTAARSTLRAWDALMPRRECTRGGSSGTAPGTGSEPAAGHGRYPPPSSHNGRLCQALDVRDPSQSAITLNVIRSVSSGRPRQRSRPGLGQVVDHWGKTEAPDGARNRPLRPEGRPARSRTVLGHILASGSGHAPTLSGGLSDP